MFFETKNLCFSYYRAPLCLKDVNFSVAPNSKTLILASKDSGKSTILKVLSGFEDSRFGNIYLNGKELKQISDKEKNFSLVLAEPILFEKKSVKQNLEYQIEVSGLENFDDEKLTKILKESNLNIDLKTKVKKLSLCEKRKLQIARGLLKTPQIMFIDDLFEGLENEEIHGMLQVYQKILKKKDLTIIFAIGDEAYKNIKGEISQNAFNKIIYLNLAETTEFKSLEEFEESYKSLDMLNFINTENVYFKQIEKEDKVYSLLNGEAIQFKFDSFFNKALDELKLEFAEVEDCVIVLKTDDNLDKLTEAEFNDLLKSNKCIIFSKLTEKRVI